MDERIALSRRARSVFGGFGETALGERAPYFDRRKAIYQVGRFLLRLAPFGLLGCRFSRLASTFPWPCSLLSPRLPLFLVFSGASPSPTLALCREVEDPNYSFRKHFLGQVVVYDVPRGIWYVGS
jgi:hypothetical protein